MKVRHDQRSHGENRRILAENTSLSISAAYDVGVMSNVY